jgi:hypothetical protein
VAASSGAGITPTTMTNAGGAGHKLDVGRGGAGTGGATSPSSLGVGGLDGVGITLINPASNKQAIVACG